MDETTEESHRVNDRWSITPEAVKRLRVLVSWRMDRIITKACETVERGACLTKEQVEAATIAVQKEEDDDERKRKNAENSN